MESLLSLEQVDLECLPRVGGKAARLGALLRAGLPVPRGFVVTTDAHEQFITREAIRPRLEQLLETIDPIDPSAPERAARSIADLLGSASVPESVAAPVREAYRRLGSPPVAVRSSATAEDSPTRSFAGQLDSYLDVRGDAAVVDAVRRCWLSLWSPRAIAYRARQAIPFSELRLAVIVQELVQAEAAGVLFTAHPVNGHRGRTVIEAVWGLGDALADGRAAPDRWVVDSTAGTVHERHVARRERPALTEAQLTELVQLGRRSAAHFGAPQDIEWALSSGGIHLVQSRPIAALFPLPRPEPPAASGLRVYVCANLVQGVVEPLTPLGVSLLRGMVDGRPSSEHDAPPGAAPTTGHSAAGRLFVDVTAFLRHRRTRHAFPRFFGIEDQPVARILKALVEREPRLSPQRGRFPVKLSAGLVLSALGGLLRALRSAEAARRRATEDADRWARHIEARAAEATDLTACLRFLELELVSPWSRLMEIALMLPGSALLSFAESLVRRWSKEASDLQPLLRSLPHNPTMQMNLALWCVSRELSAQRVEPSVEHPAVRAFLQDYGYRAVREIDVGVPRWREDPGFVLGVLGTYLRHGAGNDPERRFLAGAESAEAALVALVERVRRTRGRLRARMLALLLRRARDLLGMREYPKFVMVRILAAVRRVVARAGEELVAGGRLDRPDDVFFLELADIGSAADLRALAARNRADHRQELERRVIPQVMTSEGECFYGAPDALPGALVGTAASAGVHEGRVSVILDPAEARLEPGEVLVAAGADPGWTPLFLSAGALVTELGGATSHASVVAREYGIPAVVGVQDATRLLRTGQRVRVDGSGGRVVVLDDEGH